MARKYKVLHLLEALDAVGGSEKIAAEIVSRLNKQEFEAEIWCIHRGGRMAEELRKQGLVIKVLGISTYHNPFNILKLAGLFRQAKPDIVHSHMYFTSTIGGLAGKLAGVPVMIKHVHSSYWHFTPRNLFIERLLSRITYKIICVSNSVRDFVVDHEKIDASRVEVIYNGISREQIFSRSQVRGDLGVPEGEIIITIVANLLENKGHKVLLEALSLLAGQYPHIKCWIVGEGPLDAQLKAYVKQLKIGSMVVFWGMRQDVSQILSASDIFVMASLEREGMSLSVMEAMAHQIPVIVTRVGGLPEIVDDEQNGLIVPPKDAAALSKAIKRLIDNPKQRAFLVQRAAEKFEREFQSWIMLSKIEKLYKESLQ